VEHGAVLARPALRLPRRLHLSDLLPDATAGASAEVETPSGSAADGPAAVGSDRRALVEAPTLPIEPDIPGVLGDALMRAVERYADPRITYVSAKRSRRCLPKPSRRWPDCGAMGSPPGPMFFSSSPNRATSSRHSGPACWAVSSR
jgi:hypothetical protein